MLCSKFPQFANSTAYAGENIELILLIAGKNKDEIKNRPKAAYFLLKQFISLMRQCLQFKHMVIIIVRHGKTTFLTHA